MRDRKITRRQLFRLGPGGAADLLLAAKNRDDAARADEAPIRPPGASRLESEFLSACERCGECVKACPYDAITSLGPSFGPLDGSPVLDPNANPCRWCPEMDCVQACPSGALSFTAGGGDGNGERNSLHVGPIAKAALDPNACLNTQGILCDRCAVTCPADVKAISMRGRTPVLDAKKCVGCGLCVLYCEADPKALKVSPLS